MSRTTLTEARIRALKPRKTAYVLRDTKLRGFGVRVLPSGRKRFFVHCQHRGERVWKIVGDAATMDVREARSRATAMLAAIRRGEDVSCETAEGLFEAVAETVFRRHERVWKSGTLYVNRCYLRNQLLPHFAGRRIADIGRDDVRNWFASLHATPVAADRSMPVLSVIMREAEVMGLRPEGSNPCRAARLMRLMGLQAIYRAPRTSAPHPEHRVWPYLLRGLAIERPNNVWCADITYIPVQRGFLYLVAIMDWASRYVLAWRLSNTLDASFCTDALEEALARHGKPEIFNTDQGSQFTSFAFTGRLQAAGIRISMDGRGRCMDNIFIERLWRSLKYEAVYLHEIADGLTARRLIAEWVRFYNLERPHAALDGRTPAEAYRDETPVDMMDKPLRALPTSPQAQQQQQEDRFKGILAA